MSQNNRQLVLNVFLLRYGHHPAGWRHPVWKENGRPDLQWWVRAAQIAEAAKFDTFFVADFIGRSGNVNAQSVKTPNNFHFEPFTLLSAIAAHTKHIGLVATVNTNFSDPYNVARQFTSLDHLSGGRAGWNVVSSLNPATAKNFGFSEVAAHDERYEQAAEFVDLAKAYWDSWDDDAFDHPDPQHNLFYQPDAAHPVHFKGKHHRGEGLLDLPRPIQGYPVFVQAGNSEVGREFAARYAEMTYSSATSLKVAQDYYTDVKKRLAKYGRSEDQLKITPGLNVVVADSDQEAQDRFAELQNLVDFSEIPFGGYDLAKFPLDEPLPDLPYDPGENGRGRFFQQLELARRENLTIRQLVLKFQVARGHVQAIGSAKTVADLIEQWFVEKGADGFNVVPPYSIKGLEDFTRLVVPELQKRGLFRKEYTGSTYRENLGLLRPENPNSLHPLQSKRA